MAAHRPSRSVSAGSSAAARPPPATPFAERPIIFCIDSPGLGGAELNLLRIIEAVGVERVALVHGEPPDPVVLGFVARAGIPATRGSYANDIRGAPRGISRALRTIARNPRACYVIWAHHPDTCRWFQFTLALLRRRYIIAEQTIPQDALVFERSRLSRPLKRFAVRHASAVVLNAASQRQRYADVFRVDPRELVVISSGRDTRSIATKADELRANRAELRASLRLPDAPLVLCVSRLVPGKGQATIVQAMGSEPLVRRGVHLALVGDGPDRERLQSLACSIAPGRVHFVGYQEDPVPWLAASDVFAFMSHTEGLPGALIEALAAAVPCVATDIPGNSELVIHRRTGLRVPVGDTSALVSAIAEYLDSPDLRRALAEEAARHVASRYDQSAEHDSWVRLLEAGGDSGVLRPIAERAGR